MKKIEWREPLGGYQIGVGPEGVGRYYLIWRTDEGFVTAVAGRPPGVKRTMQLGAPAVTRQAAQQKAELHYNGVPHEAPAQETEMPYTLEGEKNRVSNGYNFVKSSGRDDTLPLDFSGLQAVFDDAMRQTESGKGAERHGNGLPFHEQPLFKITHLVGPGFAGGQAIKKLQEALGMIANGEYERADRELLGAIVYTGALALMCRNPKLFGRSEKKEEIV